MRLVYLVDEEKRWIVSASRALAEVIGTLLLFNQLTFAADYSAEGYSTAGLMIRMTFTILSLLVFSIGLYYTFKLQKAPQSIYELSMFDQEDDVSDLTI